MDVQLNLFQVLTNQACPVFSVCHANLDALRNNYLHIFPSIDPTLFSKYCNDDREYEINNPPKISIGTTKKKSKSRNTLYENIGLLAKQETAVIFIFINKILKTNEDFNETTPGAANKNW